MLKDKLTPKAIVAALNEHIVGQDDAKKAVAVALRNRWRRQQLGPELRDEVTPKNILMIGPTGCGKTEISRRLAKLADAPFVKVEATKFTEVGYVGRDVEQIARDLVEEAVRLERERRRAKVRAGAEEAAMDRLLEALTGERTFPGPPMAAVLASCGRTPPYRRGDFTLGARAVRVAGKVEPVFVESVAELPADVAAWDDAKKSSDFALFRPHLERQLELKHQYIACFPEVDEPYDALLDEYEARADKVENQFRRGIITDGERRQQEVRIWTDATAEVQKAMDALLAGVPEEKSERTPEQQARCHVPPSRDRRERGEREDRRLLRHHPERVAR